jgi:hypothetical protein
VGPTHCWLVFPSAANSTAETWSMRFRVLCGFVPCEKNLCPCEGRPLEVPNPAATQVHPHRDVWWSTARPSGHPWAQLSALTSFKAMRLVRAPPRWGELEKQAGAGGRKRRARVGTGALGKQPVRPCALEGGLALPMSDLREPHEPQRQNDSAAVLLRAITTSR